MADSPAHSVSHDIRGSTEHTATTARARLIAVVAATVAALVVWVVFVALGIDLQEPTFGAGQATRDLGAVPVVVASAVASLAGWGLLALLERFTARARAVWTVVAVVVLVLSLGGPLSAAGITTANRIALLLMHLAVGAVLIPLLSRTSRHRRPSAS